MTNLFDKIRQYISENRDYIDRDETIADFIIKNLENNTDGYEFWLGDNPSEYDRFHFKYLIMQEYDKTMWEVYSELYSCFEKEILQSIKDMCYRTDYKDGWLDYINNLKNDIQTYWESLEGCDNDGYTNEFMEQYIEDENIHDVDNYELVKFLVDANSFFTI